MQRCDRCKREVARRYRLVAWDDQEHERFAYTELLNLYDDAQAEMMFPGREVTLSLCGDCYAALTGAPPLAVSIASTKTSVKPTPSHQELFTMRTLQAELATALARALFEHCGYEVRHIGYEYLAPEWVSRMITGDANPAVARIRATPDLRVYDGQLNSVYEVEIKTTNQLLPSWQYRKDQLDTIRYHHPDAILMVYAQRTHSFYAQYLKAIDWGRTNTRQIRDRAFYELRLGDQLAGPHHLFPLMTLESYEAFMRQSKETLRTFSA